MSNATLKEQLESLGLSSAVKEKPVHKKNRPQPAKAEKVDKNPKKQHKPAWLEQAQYGVELLKAYFPACFKDIKDIQPLKIGIKQDLVKRLSTLDNVVIGDKACMVNSLAYYVNSPAYHKRVLAGVTRVDLDGNSVGLVTAEEAQYSIDCRKTKLEKAKSNQQSPSVNTTEETEK